MRRRPASTWRHIQGRHCTFSPQVRCPGSAWYAVSNAGVKSASSLSHRLPRHASFAPQSCRKCMSLAVHGSAAHSWYNIRCRLSACDPCCCSRSADAQRGTRGACAARCGGTRRTPHHVPLRGRPPARHLPHAGLGKAGRTQSRDSERFTHVATASAALPDARTCGVLQLSEGPTDLHAAELSTLHLTCVLEAHMHQSCI